MKKWGFTLLFVVGLSSCGGSPFSTPREERGELTILSWNVQNLFDEIDDGNEYFEFRAENRIWNRKVLYNKLEAMSEVLRSLDSLPDIMIWQEVEHPSLVARFFQRFLKSRDYHTVVGTGGSSPQVLVSSCVPLEQIETLSLGLEGTKPRQAIKVELTWRDIPISLVGVHLKSWVGESARNRFIRGEELTALGEWLAPDVKEGRVVLIVGDLNTRTRADLGGELGEKGEGTLGDSGFFIQDLTAGRQDGTYSSKDGLFWLDGILLAGKLPEDKDIEIQVLDSHSLITTEEGNPNRWSSFNPRGISDHFPFLVRFKDK